MGGIIQVEILNVTSAESDAGHREGAVDEEFDCHQIGGRGTHIARKGDEIAAGRESDSFGFRFERSVLGGLPTCWCAG